MNRVGSHALSTKGWEVVFGRKENICCCTHYSVRTGTEFLRYGFRIHCQK